MDIERLRFNQDCAVTKSYGYEMTIYIEEKKADFVKVSTYWQWDFNKLQLKKGKLNFEYMNQIKSTKSHL